MIDGTQHLDWLTLTKRPQNIGQFWADVLDEPIGQMRRRANVWLGTSVGTQKTANELVPRLVEWRDLSPILFLSVEPLLEPIRDLPLDSIDWVIVGGESGAGARAMEKDWVVDILRQCEESGTSFFFKQWGGVNKKSRGRELLRRSWDEIPLPILSREEP